MPINLLLACDYLNEQIGENCQFCKHHFLQNIDRHQLNITELDGDLCKKDNMEAEITNFNQAPFIFVAYSHGKADALTSMHGAYLTTSNAYFLSNSFFYSNACFVGKELGHRLIAENCHTVIAYEDEVHYLPFYENYFVECENFALIHFFNSNETIEMSVSKMIDYYNVKIDELQALNFIAASLLTNNRDNLIVLGNEQLRIEDFMI
jgi:hypothetical protein